MTISMEKTADVFNIAIKGYRDFARFKELVHRGANLWPDAPDNIKVFADWVSGATKESIGTALQDYAAQNRDQREGKFKLPPDVKTYEPVAAGKYRQCKHCGCYLASHYSPGNTCYPIPGLDYVVSTEKVKENSTPLIISTTLPVDGTNPGE